MKRSKPLRRGDKPLKKNTGTLKRTGFKTISKGLKRGTRKKNAPDGQWEADQVFYQELWKKRPHFCFESGSYLGEEPRSYMFHHVLPKEKYPQYRYCEWNIVLLSWERHDQVHSNLDKAPRVKFLYGQLIKKHEEGSLGCSSAVLEKDIASVGNHLRTDDRDSADDESQPDSQLHKTS